MDSTDLADATLTAIIRPTMPRVTALRPVPSDPSLLDVMVDGRSIGAALRSVVETMAIGEGAVLSAAKRKKLLEAIEIARARTVALKTLSRSDRSRGLLKAILVEKYDCEPAAAATALDQLAADGWLDDSRYAAARARTMAEDGGYASEAIASRLVDDGIRERDADRIARAAAPPRDDRARALALAKTALASSRGRAAKPARTGGRRNSPADAASLRKSAGLIARMLGRRGFDADTIATTMERLGLSSRDNAADD